jgi:hypothetical protein
MQKFNMPNDLMTEIMGRIHLIDDSQILLEWRTVYFSFLWM